MRSRRKRILQRTRVGWVKCGCGSVMKGGEAGNRLYARFDLLERVSCAIRVLASRYSSSSVANIPSSFDLKIASKTRRYAGPFGRPMSSRSWPVREISHGNFTFCITNCPARCRKLNPRKIQKLIVQDLVVYWNWPGLRRRLQVRYIVEHVYSGSSRRADREGITEFFPYGICL
jgi:hypothetical protein